jgi:hypothetical protein
MSVETVKEWSERIIAKMPAIAQQVSEVAATSGVSAETLWSRMYYEAFPERILEAQWASATKH